ncbi:MAG: FtsX-like permease family protein, partial [Lachnospiraceae bacterium]
MKHMGFIRLYIKRSFTKNLKKQLFLILGIAAFMALATEQIIGSDSEYNDVTEKIENFYWGYSEKFFALSAEQRQFLLAHPEITDSYTIYYFDVTKGITNGSFLVSADFPESFRTTYVYGTDPGPGEVALPEKARIAGKRPKIGQEIVFEIQLGEETKAIHAKVSGVFEEHSTYNAAYVAMYAADFEHLFFQTDSEAACLADVLYNCSDEEASWDIWAETLEKYGSQMKHMRCKQSETPSALGSLETISFNLYIPVMIGAVSMIAIIYILLKDERKTLGIFRALGATKRQLVQMLTARMTVLALAGAGLGALLGEGM